MGKKNQLLFFNTECIYSAYRGTFNDDARIKHSAARECYSCSNFYGRKDKYNRHIENCTGKLDIPYVY